MDPQIKDFAKIEQFIRNRPKSADDSVFQWQNFLKRYPEASSIQSREEFGAWAKAHNINPDIWSGREIADAYFYLREQHEMTQMQKEGGVDPSIVPQYLIAAPLLASMFFQRKRIMQDDDDYKKIENTLKEDWLKKNPGKDFASKEGLDYLHGSLDNDNNPSLRKDAEKTFRANTKYQKRIERFDREKAKIYKHIDDDPAVARLKTEIDEHTNARGGDPDGIIQRKSWERFVKEHPEKVQAYAEKEDDRKNANFRRFMKEAAERDQGGNAMRYTEKTTLRQTTSSSTFQPQMQTSSRGLFNRTAGRMGRLGRGSSRMGGRLAGRTGSMATRLGSRLAARAGMMLGQAAIKAGVTLVANPVGLTILGIIALIVILVFFIIFFSGDSKPVAAIEGCLGADGKAIVTNGSDCATALADFYRIDEGNPSLTATCVDKCTDSARTLSCDRDPDNTCDVGLYPSLCGGDMVFCIEYSPPDASLGRFYDCLTGGPGFFGSPGGVNSCGTPSGSVPTLADLQELVDLQARIDLIATKQPLLDHFSVSLDEATQVATLFTAPDGEIKPTAFNVITRVVNSKSLGWDPTTETYQAWYEKEGQFIYPQTDADLRAAGLITDKEVQVVNRSFQTESLNILEQQIAIANKYPGSVDELLDLAAQRGLVPST